VVPVVPRVAWEGATSAAAAGPHVMEPVLKYPHPVVSDQSKPAVQLH
jgi:hypothetical protein